MTLLEDVRVVVRQLLARLDISNRLDPNPAVLDHRVAIRIARVIDESRLVSADSRVDHDVVIDREQERVVALALDVRIARVRLGRRQTFARILYKPRPGGNATRREGTEALNRRAANLERIPTIGQEGGPFSVLCSTCVTPPEMMNAMTSLASASMRCTWLDGTTRIWPASPYDCGM